MKNKMAGILFLMCFFYPTMLLAGPGGRIAKAVGETLAGKIVLMILFVIFLPVAVYVLAKEYRAKRRVLQELALLAVSYPDFDWIKLRQRILDCFYRVHSAWEKIDVSEAAEWMTSWYWQNQQLVFLNRWERDGLVNICEVHKVNYIKPIMFAYRNDGSFPHQGSQLAVLIEARMKDYLQRKCDGKVVEGSKPKKNVERVWCFTFENGKWVVSGIDEGSNCLQYIEMLAQVPKLRQVPHKAGERLREKNSEIG